MKRSLVYMTVLSEATGQPIECLEGTLKEFSRAMHIRNMDDDLSPSNADALFEVLRSNKSGIRNWMMLNS